VFSDTSGEGTLRRCSTIRGSRESARERSACGCRGQATARATRPSLSDPSPRFLPPLEEGTLQLRGFRTGGRLANAACPRAAAQKPPPLSAQLSRGSTTHYSPPRVAGPTVMACQVTPLPTRRGVTPVCVRTRRSTGRAARRIRRASRAIAARLRARVSPPSPRHFVVSQTPSMYWTIQGTEYRGESLSTPGEGLLGRAEIPGHSEQRARDEPLGAWGSARSA